MARIRRSLVYLCLSGVALAVLSGCGDEHDFAKVQGQVTVKGKGAGKVRIEFHPDATKGTKGPSSTAETDEEGRFTLTYATPKRTGPGAVVGWHKVVLHDLRLAESETGHGVPIRFGQEYTSVLSTPLAIEVKSGEQTIPIVVPNK